jgi:hypothetical protein
MKNCTILLLSLFLFSKINAQDLSLLNYEQIDSVLMPYAENNLLDEGIARTETKKISPPFQPKDSIYGKLIAWRAYLYGKKGDYSNSEKLLKEAPPLPVPLCMPVPLH